MPPFYKSIGQNLAKNNLSIIILIAVLSITFSLYRISEAERELNKNVQELGRENERYYGISEEIDHLSEKIDLSIKLYIQSNDEQFKQNYNNYRGELTALLSKELRASSDEFIMKSLEKIKKCEAKMEAHEDLAISYLHSNNKQKALAELEQEEYLKDKVNYANELNSISSYLIEAAEANKRAISDDLKQNHLLYFVILMTNLGTWLLLVTMFNRSKKQVADSNIELQKVNNALYESISIENVEATVKEDVHAVMQRYLRFLKNNLPFSNFHIIEKKNKKFYAIESVLAAKTNSYLIDDEFLNESALEKYMDNVLSANEIIGYIKEGLIYHPHLSNPGIALACLAINIKSDINRKILLLVEGDEQHLVKESDLAILQIISSQLKIALENAYIYSNMEDTIERRTYQLKDANLQLREKEEKLTAAQHIAKLGNWEISTIDEKITISDEVLDIVGIKGNRKTFDSNFFSQFVEDQDYKDAVASFDAFIKDNEISDIVVKIRTADNDEKFVNIRAAEKKRIKDNVILFGTVQDITERKNIELAYKESRERFLNVFENNQTGVIVTDNQHRFTMVNTQFVNMLGYSKEELDEMTIFDIANIEQREKTIQLYNNLMQGEISNFVEQKQYKRKDGNHIHVITKTFGNYDSKGNFLEAVASVLDITQQVETNKKVMESIIETENLERTRIATTLHDSIGQNLTSLHLMLGAISKSETIGEDDLANIEKAIKVTKDTILETRQISHNLMPKYISRFGLIASVDNLVKDLNATKSGTEFSLYSNFKDEILSVSTQIAIYRIVQEAVNNILKYSKATNVYLQLVKHGNIVTVLIDDNGCGFDLESALNKESLGLKSIQNRANSISAELEIDTMPDRGTTISLQLTLNNEND